VIRYLIAPLSALALRMLAALALLLACFVPNAIAPRVPADTVVLVDRSLSMPVRETDAAWAQVLRQRHQSHVSSLLFARDVVAAAGDLQPRERAATDLEQALDAGLQAMRPGAEGELIVISDGQATEGVTERALESARRSAIPVMWIGVGRTPAERIVSVEAPDEVAVGESIAMSVTVAGESELQVIASTSDGGRQTVSVPTGPSTRSVEFRIPAERAGPLTVSVGLEDSAGQSIEAVKPAALVTVRGAPRVLYVSRSPGPLAASLAAGGWPVDQVSPERAPVTAQALSDYGSAVLEDVALSDPPAAFWTALAGAVSEHGLGLAVLGGPAAFAAGGYRGSTLESVLPVITEPNPEEASAAIVFVVDKSGSMGRGSSGVDRLSVARSAVIATAVGLPPSAEVALVAFDVNPRVLLPLTPYAQIAGSLSAPWPIAAAGGTRIGPAVEAAAGLLAGTHAARRIVVLASDGYVGAESLAAARRALTDSHAELLVLAIGADADLPALGALVQGVGEVLPVAAIAELPDLMRSAFARHVGRVVKGPVPVRAARPLPFAPDGITWPDVAAYSPVRARPGAAVYLETDSGDPILATESFGTGLTAALPAGLGSWTPRWPQAQLWPGFSGGLIDWISRGRSDRSLGLAVGERRGTLTVTIDAAQGPDWSRASAVALKILGPDGQLTDTEARARVPGRFVASVPVSAAGAYQITALSGGARSERAVLARAQDESESGVSPALDGWVRAGLIRRVAASDLPAAPRAADTPAGRLRLAALALALLIAALAIDYRTVWFAGRAAIMGRIARQ
jgi:Ca-activated chloride channel homolog